MAGGLGGIIEYNVGVIEDSLAGLDWAQGLTQRQGLYGGLTVAVGGGEGRVGEGRSPWRHCHSVAS